MKKCSRYRPGCGPWVEV